MDDTERLEALREIAEYKKKTLDETLKQYRLSDNDRWCMYQGERIIWDWISIILSDDTLLIHEYVKTKTGE